MNRPSAKLQSDMCFFDVSWVKDPLYGFAKIQVLCPECEEMHQLGEHPDTGCRMGVVDNVMRS